MLPEVVDRCTPNHVAVTAEAYLDPTAVARWARRPYELRRRTSCVALISEQEGRISSCDRLRALRELPAYAGEFAMLGIGDRIVRTVDLFSSPGSVYLLYDEDSATFEEYERLRRSRALASTTSSPATPERPRPSTQRCLRTSTDSRSRSRCRPSARDLDRSLRKLPRRHGRARERDRAQLPPDCCLQIPDFAPPEVRAAVFAEVHQLLDTRAQRRDLTVASTGNSPRRYDALSRDQIVEASTR